jgi:protein SPT2
LPVQQWTDEWNEASSIWLQICLRSSKSSLPYWLQKAAKKEAEEERGGGRGRGEEYDSEMDDFIENEGEPQEEISKHIQEIFGYDQKQKYKDESDYALCYMESSWKEQQKEEAKNLRLGMQEDLEEMRREEMICPKAKKLKRC